jgi:dethiobiotin synthetase
VTGTDTGVGKTVVAGAVAAALRARGERVDTYKPAITGFDDPPGEWPTDDVVLGDAIVPYRFGPAVSPHLAAELAGEPIDPGVLLGAVPADTTVIAEGVGGLLVPLTPDFSVRDLAKLMGLPLLIAARPGLGTINHTLLTLEAARAGGLTVASVVITPWPDEPSVMERSNRETIERHAPVATLPRCTPDTLAQAGAQLPIDDWL